MQVGLIARAEDRGLGIQLWEWCRHMNPAKVLLVDMGRLARGFRPHPERYPADRTTTVPFEGGELPMDTVVAWLQGLDVVYSVETLYDWRLADWARTLGVRTVVHCNPEFYRHGAQPDLPHPDAWWAATPWLQDEPGIDFPPMRLVPVPVPTDRWQPSVEPHDGPLRWLHVGGHRAAGDRNGTGVMLEAIRHLREHHQMTVTTQDLRLPRVQPGRHVRYKHQLQSVPNYWDLYPGHDLLVLPRRYGGLCLPAHEAAGAGLGLVLTACSPNQQVWPSHPIPVQQRDSIRVGPGRVRAHDVRPQHLAALMDDLAGDRDLAWRLRCQALEWAQQHSWAKLRPVIENELRQVCNAD